MGEYVHSKQARFDKSFVSCGVLEVHHLPNTTPSQTVFAILTALYRNPRPAAFVIFSDVVGSRRSYPTRGEKLAHYLKEIIGTDLWESKKEVNPRTGNTIRLWVWRLDHEVLWKLYQDELAKHVSEEA